LKIDHKPLSYDGYKQGLKELIRGKIPKLAPKQVDDGKENQGYRLRKNHRIQYTYNKELKKNVVHVVDNKTGDVVNKAISDAEVDRRIRVQRGIERTLGDVFDQKV